MAKDEIDSLRDAVSRSYENLERFRKLNKSIVESYHGGGYGEGKIKEKYLNKLQQAVDAYTMLLAANRPRVSIDTHNRSLRPFAKTFEVALNNLLVEIGIEKTIQAWVLDAFFCVGIVRAHVKDYGEVRFESDFYMDPGLPFASNIALDDFVFDMTAQKWSEVKYAGDMYDMPVADVKQAIKDGMFSTKARGAPERTNQQIDSDRLEYITRRYTGDDSDFEPVVQLADIWIPRQQKICTYVLADKHSFKIDTEIGKIGEYEWSQDHGPYKMLGFHSVPRNVMPLSPAMLLEPMDRAVNNMMREQVRRAAAFKENTIYSPAGEATARLLQNARDLQMLKGTPSEIAKVRSGGIDPVSQSFLNEMLAMYDAQAGNLTAILGLGAQADTLGQEQLIHGAGNRKIGAMQSVVVDAVVELIKTLGLMLWEDPHYTHVGEKVIDGAQGLTAETMWSPDDREGSFLDYNFSINISSMPYKTPSQELEEVQGMLERFYIPLEQRIAAQGGTIDFQAIQEMHADLLNQPAFRRIINFGGENQQPAEATQESRKSPTTRREYVRRNISGGSPQSQAKSSAQSWLGAAEANGSGIQQMGAGV